MSPFSGRYYPLFLSIQWQRFNGKYYPLLHSVADINPCLSILWHILSLTSSFTDRYYPLSLHSVADNPLISLFIGRCYLLPVHSVADIILYLSIQGRFKQFSLHSKADLIPYLSFQGDRYHPYSIQGQIFPTLPISGKDYPLHLHSVTDIIP
jgi:hypothetical protein